MQWLVVGLALLALFAAGWADLAQRRDFAESREKDRLLAMSKVIAVDIELHLLAVNSVLTKLQQEVPRAAHDPGFNERLVTLTDAMPSIRTLSVQDASATIRASNRRELLGQNQHFSEREYFSVPRQQPSTETLYVSPPFMTTTGVYTIVLSRMIAGPGGEFAGVVTATLDPEYFRPMIDSVRYAPDSFSTLIHGDGVIFMAAPTERANAVGSRLAHPGSMFVRHKESGQTASVTSGLVHIAGMEGMVAHRTVQPPELKMNKPLAVAVGRMSAGILAPWHQDRSSRALAFSLVALAAVGGLGVYQRQTSRSMRKQAEARDALIASEQFLRTVTDNIPVYIAYWNDEMRCTYCNALFREWFGKTEEQMQGIHARDLFSEAVFASNEAIFRAALRGERQDFQAVRTRADGSVRHTWAHAVPDRVGDRIQGVFMLAADVTDIKQAEIALAQSEAKLKTIIDVAPDCIKVLAPDGSLLQMNRAGLDMIEADSQEQAIGRKMSDLVAPEFHTAFARVQARVNRGETAELEFQITGMKGTPRWLETHAAPLRDAQGAVISLLGVTRDVTERKAMELALARFEAIVESSQDAIVGQTLDGVVTSWNRGAEKMFGYTAAESIGQRMFELLPADRRDEEVSVLMRIVRGETVERFQTIRLRKDGTAIDVSLTISPIRDAQGAIVGASKIAHDITERKQAQDLLRASEARYRLLAEHSHDVIWTLDATTGRFTYVSPSVERLRGLTPEEVMAQPMLASLTPESAAVAMAELGAAMERIKAGDFTDMDIVMEVDQNHRDGSIVHSEVVAAWVFDDSGAPTNTILGVTRDIGERKKAQQALEHLAHFDALTGLANRSTFMAAAEQELARATRYGGGLSALMIDIDHFKTINDTYGHQTGDHVLRRLGGIFKETLREIDLIGRIGGEEFAVILPQTSREQAIEAAERLRRAVAQTEVPLDRGRPLRLTVSIGVATLAGRETNLDTLLALADGALYEAKRAGRNCVCVDGSEPG